MFAQSEWTCTPIVGMFSITLPRGRRMRRNKRRAESTVHAFDSQLKSLGLLGRQP